MAHDSHGRLQQWLKVNYPRPQIDPEWLNDCLLWLSNSQSLTTNQLEIQLLSSDLRDSMLPGTGLPTHVALPTTNTFLTGPPILVEIVAITEIAHSAFNLDQIRAAREERASLGRVSADDAEGDIDVDEGPPPKYPRGMLKFELTDGVISLPAIEYRSLPQITLGVTPLGFKMQLKNVKICNGIAWLEPKTVIIKGHSTDDREKAQKFDFARGLRMRMGLPPLPVPQHMQDPGFPVSPRSPLRDISPPPPDPMYNDDGILENRRRRLPATVPTSINSTPLPYFSQDEIIDMTREDSFEHVSLRGEQGCVENRRSAMLPDTKGKAKTMAAIDDDDFDENNLVLDQEFLESLDRVESEAMQGMGTSREPSAALTSSTAGSIPSGNISTYRPATQDVIEIGDDEDWDDKENMPVATRHVRRRTNFGSQDLGPAISGDVIDLSDSD